MKFVCLQVAICPKCDGEGQVPAHYCTECRGDGRVNVVRNINVEIPAGVKNGSTLRVRGEGHAGKRGYVFNFNFQSTL